MAHTDSTQGMEPRDPIRLRQEVGIWGSRGFILLFAVAGVVVVGYALIPSLASVAGVISLLLFFGAVVCVVITVFKLAQFLVARRTPAP